MISFSLSGKQSDNLEHRQKILVVDDEELAQNVLRYFLSKKYEVFTCGSVSQFYNLISQYSFDLIVMDIFLRDIKDGIQLTRELKQMENYKHTPIFVLSAHNTTKDRFEVMDAGASRFLTKPVDPKFLLDSVEEILRKQKAS